MSIHVIISLKQNINYSFQRFKPLIGYKVLQSLVLRAGNMKLVLRSRLDSSPLYGESPFTI